MWYYIIMGVCDGYGAFITITTAAAVAAVVHIQKNRNVLNKLITMTNGNVDTDDRNCFPALYTKFGPIGFLVRLITADRIGSRRRRMNGFLAVYSGSSKIDVGFRTPGTNYRRDVQVGR